MIKTYTLLTKPGILFGNAITTASGFALASKGHIDYGLFLATLLGLGGVIASACVFNNTIDRIADAKMERTKTRPLVTGLVKPNQAILFASILGVLGTIILWLFTNPLATAVALVGFFIYVVLYSYWKYHSTWGTIIGSMAGATPPVVGYCAVADKLDLGAFLLFLILVLWQMPHFYAIAVYRYKDYSAASIPVLPIAKGIPTAKVHMAIWVVAFLVAALSLTYFGYTGQAYAVITLVLGLAWLALSLVGFVSTNEARWGRQMFALSLVVVTVLCVAMSVDTVN